MQRSPQEIKDKLLKALDSEYNVIDMPVVVEIIGILEQTSITKEALETTRLGKYVNELRRKTKNDSLAKRAKDLVRKWRHLIVPEATPGNNGVRQVNNKLIPRTGQLSPGLPARLSQPSSPSSRVSSLSPDNKQTFTPGVSPAISPRLPGYTPAPPAGRVSTPVSPAVPPAPATPIETPRRRGRPPKNKNKHKRPLSPGHATDLVPKTSPANKRLRKNSTEHDGKAAHANGVCTNHLSVSEVPSDSKKAGRSKGSRNSRHHEEDLVKGAMASIARTSKVKTTRELLQSIQQESSLDALRSKTLVSLGVAKPDKAEKPGSSTEHIHKFLHSSKNDVSPKKVKSEENRPSRTATLSVPPLRPPTPPSPTGSDIIDVEKVSGCEDTPEKPPSLPVAPVKPQFKTVEEILAQLPRINPDEILWSDPDSDVDMDMEESPREVTDLDVLRLHAEHVEGLNGNHTDGVAARVSEAAPHGLQVPIDPSCGASTPSCPEDCAFREWHETLSRTSYNGELLHILPYVIID